MATSPLPAGDAPANGALAPDTFWKLASDTYVVQDGLAALFDAIDDALSVPPPDDKAQAHSWNLAASLARLGISEAARLTKMIQQVEVAGYQFERQAK